MRKHNFAMVEVLVLGLFFTYVGLTIHVNKNSFESPRSGAMEDVKDERKFNLVKESREFLRDFKAN